MPFGCRTEKDAHQLSEGLESLGIMGDQLNTSLNLSIRQCCDSTRMFSNRPSFSWSTPVSLTVIRLIDVLFPVLGTYWPIIFYIRALVEYAVFIFNSSVCMLFCLPVTFSMNFTSILVKVWMHVLSMIIGCNWIIFILIIIIRALTLLN